MLVNRYQSNCRRMRDNFCSFYKPPHYTESIKYLFRVKKLEWSNCIYYIGCTGNKVVIELGVVQFWSEIILTCDFKSCI